jgi:hypothetical protein
MLHSEQLIPEVNANIKLLQTDNKRKYFFFDTIGCHVFLYMLYRFFPPVFYSIFLGSKLFFMVYFKQKFYIVLSIAYGHKRNYIGMILKKFVTNINLLKNKRRRRRLLEKFEKNKNQKILQKMYLI